MPVCFCPEQVIAAYARQIVIGYSGKHLPGCYEPSSKPEDSRCRCFSPERVLFLESYAEDVARREYESRLNNLLKGETFL